ncbi:MAG TPA: AN1-type zinc finger protein [Thermoplasmata archaeon]|nr:AN1-type zinc finger protein [Thermoplasmata archaeon]
MVFSCIRCGDKFCALHRNRSSHSCRAQAATVQGSIPSARKSQFPAKPAQDSAVSSEDAYQRHRAEAAGGIAAVSVMVQRARARGMDVAEFEIGLRDANAALILADPGHALVLARRLGERLEGLLDPVD